MAQETYTVTSIEEGWQVTQRKPGGKSVVCTAASRADAELIALALNVLPTVERAAQELAEGAVGGAGKQALAQWYRQLDSRRRQQLALGESLSCLGGAGRLILALLIGISLIGGLAALTGWLLK